VCIVLLIAQGGSEREEEGRKERKREREHTENTESEPQEINREVIVEPTHLP
jgi:hypothetical protein